MYKRILQLLIITAVAAVTALIIRNYSSPLLVEQSPTRMVMGTVANITVVAKKQAIITKSIAAAFDKLVEIDEMMSDYLPDSELSQLNANAFDEPVKVSDELFEVIKAAIEYSKLSDAAFDITIGPVVELWRRSEKEGKNSTEEELAAAKAKVGYEKLILDEQNRSVRFKVDGMVLDLGAIAKGYAIDLAIGQMQKAGAVGGLVDVGGDIRCFGISPKLNNIWRVGLEDPKGGDLLEVIHLTDRAIATSGDYRRFVMIDDRKYSHIINPQTTKSASDLTSVTVIAPTAMQADALATSVSVMGHEKGLELIELVPEVEAIVIPAGEQIEFIKTGGAEKFISE